MFRDITTDNFNRAEKQTTLHYASFLNTDKADFLATITKQAYLEDIQSGDHTTLATVPADARGSATLVAKAQGLVAGISLAEDLFPKFHSDITLHPLKQDGDAVTEGEEIFTLSGSVRGIITGERQVLNYIQHLSGIATKARHLTHKLTGYSCGLLDTRKTTPGLRLLEKWAVTLGGAHNHRMGLFDMVMLKDNHIDYAGGMDEAVRAVQTYLSAHGLSVPVVVEARSLEEVKTILTYDGIDRILLDNMSPETLTSAVALIDGRVATEASGGVDEANLHSIAATGVDYISTSQLTRAVTPLDVSLKLNT